MGIRDDHFVEIREGLKEGEIVIADGYQVLQPKDRISIADGPIPDSSVESGIANSNLQPAEVSHAILAESSR